MVAPEHMDAKSRSETASDNIVIFSDATWWQFETLLAVRGDATVPRMAYLDGQVELMSPSRVHEVTKGTLGRLVETYADIRGVSVESRGSETLKLPYQERGAEPDECYDIGDGQEFPRLVIEVVKTSRGLNKFRIYAAFEIEEFWRWVDGEFEMYRLTDDGYAPVTESVVLPGITQNVITELLTLGSQTAAVRGLRAKLTEGG
ncbi:MAG: Uma2 family endonuclease [Myxococcota bacterium]